MFIQSTWARKYHTFFFGLLLTGMLAACGGGGGGGGAPVNPVSNLAGTWFGTLEDPSGGLHTISLTVDASGNVVQELVDGADTGLTATVTLETGNIFSFVFSDATEGGFIVDSSFTHAAFLDEDFNFGVVQKGAGGLPGFSNTDVVGSWSGQSVTLDANFEIAENFGSSATVASNFTFSGSDNLGGTFSGSFTAFATAFGGYGGIFNNSAGVSGGVTVFLTPDKLFAGSYACDTSDGGVTIGFPADCTFSAWNKQ